MHVLCSFDLLHPLIFQIMEEEGIAVYSKKKHLNSKCIKVYYVCTNCIRSNLMVLSGIISNVVRTCSRSSVYTYI